MEQRFDTLKIHGGYDPFEHHRASVVPIYQTAAYSLEDTYHADKQFAFAEEGPVYSRLANPTVSVLEERMKALHGGSGAIAMASRHGSCFHYSFECSREGRQDINHSQPLRRQRGLPGNTPSSDGCGGRLCRERK